MRPIVFLDINGCIGRFVPRDEREEDAELYVWWPDSIANLNHVTRATGAHIVVTSTLRRGKSLRFIRKLLRGAGVEGEVLDTTPKPRLETRGGEIRAWLDLYGPAPYVIFDDRADVDLPGFIRVGTDGITEADVRTVTEHLGVLV
jgi:hypothetical protein